jgi:hypothetical protein
MDTQFDDIGGVNVLAPGPTAAVVGTSVVVAIAVQGVGTNGGRAPLLRWRRDSAVGESFVQAEIDAPGFFAQRPGLVALANGELHALAIAPPNYPNGGAGLLQYISKDGGLHWSEAVNLGGDLPSGQAGLNGVAVCATGPASYHAFAVGTGGTFWHYVVDPANGSSTGGFDPGGMMWDALRTHVPAAAVRWNGSAIAQMDIFVVGTDATIWHAWSRTGRPDDWTWSPMPESALQFDPNQNGLCAVAAPDGVRLDVFAASHDGTLWRWTQRDYANAGWEGNGAIALSGSQVWDGVPGAAWVGDQMTAQLQVYAVGMDSSLSQWILDPQAPTWNAVISPPNLAPANACAVVWLPGREDPDVFAIMASNNLLHWPAAGSELNQGLSAPPSTTNWAGNRSMYPSVIFDPGTLGELTSCVTRADRRKRSARAVGSFWSFTDDPLCDPGGYMVRTERLASLIDGVIVHGGQPVPGVLSTATLTEFAGKPRHHLVHVEAGMKLRHLCEMLDRSFGWAVPTMGGSAGQAVAGVVSNGVHGGDFDRPPVADMVRAIHLVGPDGTQYWIEPTVGFTDRRALAPRLAPFGIVPEHIVQDDDWFNSVLVSMGCMGIVYSYVLEVVDQYWLHQTRTPGSWERDVRPLLQRRSPRLFGSADATQAPNRYIEITLNPNREADGSHHCVLTTRHEVPRPPEPTPPTGPSGLQSILDLLVSAFGRFTRNPSDATAGDVAALALNALAKGGGAREFGAIEDLLLNLFWSQGTLVDKSWLVMAGAGDGGPFKSLSVAAVFDATGDLYLQYIDEAFAIVDRLLDYNKPVGGIFSLRFTEGTRAYLGMQRFALNCHVEMDLLRGLDANQDVLHELEQLAYRLGGITHWGMFQELTDVGGLVEAYYGARKTPTGESAIDAWRRIRHVLTADGKHTAFDNAFSRRCGLSR